MDHVLNEIIWAFGSSSNINTSSFNNVLEIIPNTDWYGVEELPVIISDGFLQDTTSLTINVEPINDSPVIGQLITPLDGHIQTVPGISFSWYLQQM